MIRLTFDFCLWTDLTEKKLTFTQRYSHTHIYHWQSNLMLLPLSHLIIYIKVPFFANELLRKKLCFCIEKVVRTLSDLYQEKKCTPLVVTLVFLPCLFGSCIFRRKKAREFPFFLFQVLFHFSVFHFMFFLETDCIPWHSIRALLNSLLYLRLFLNSRHFQRINKPVFLPQQILLQTDEQIKG